MAADPLKGGSQHQSLTRCPGTSALEHKDLAIPAPGMTQGNRCPAGELGWTTTAVNVGFTDFCVSSPCGGLAEGAALCVAVSRARVWWCGVPTDVARGVKGDFPAALPSSAGCDPLPAAFLKFPSRAGTHEGYTLALFSLYFLWNIIIGPFGLLSSAFVAVFCGINILRIPVNNIFHSTGTCN